MNVKGPDGKVIFFPDGTPQDQIKAAMRKHYGGPSAAPAPAGIPWNSIPLNPLFTGLSAGAAINQLPNAGGLAGGMAGGALAGPGGAVGGAAALGALGETAKEALLGQPLSGGNIATQGALQGGMEATGLGAANLAGRVAKPLMKGALRASKGLMRDFPNIVETALQKGIPVSERGVGKATFLRRQSSGALNQTLAAAKQSGTQFATANVTANAKELLDSKVLSSATKKAIQDNIDQFVADHGPTVDPEVLKGLKRLFQDESRSAFKAERASGPSSALSGRRLFAKAMASGAKKQLETIPGVAAQEAKTASLIGAQRAVSDATLRPPRPWEIQKPMTYLGAAGPHLESRLAIMLANPSFQASLRQSPRAAAALISQLMYASQPDATAQP